MTTLALSPPPPQRWYVSTGLSMALHILFVLLVGLAVQQQDRPKPQHDFLDVILLDEQKQKDQKKPDKADAISNRSAKGGNSSGQDKLTRSAPDSLPPMLAQQAPPQAQRKDQQQAVKPRQDESIPSTPADAKKTEKAQKVQPTPNTTFRNFMPTSQALAQLSRDIARERRLKRMLSKEEDIPINTREAKYAPYAQGLVRSLEDQWRPSEAKYENFIEKERQVLMKITIERNGSLGNLVVIRPSPVPLLTESAVAAVHDASPFRPLPSSWGLDRVTFHLLFEVVEDRYVFRTLP